MNTTTSILTRNLSSAMIGIIASKRCNNLKIYNNNVYDGGESATGIFLHRSSDGCRVYGELYTAYRAKMVINGGTLLYKFPAILLMDIPVCCM